MKRSMKVFSAIAVIGIVVSAGAATHAAMAYISLSSSLDVIQASVSERDVVASKIEEIMDRSPIKPLVLEDLKARHRHNLLLKSALLEIVNDSKQKFRNDVIFWLGAFGLFSIVLIRSESYRSQADRPKH